MTSRHAPESAPGFEHRTLFRPGGWIVSSLLLFTLTLVYLSNNRSHLSPDVIGNTLLPLAVARGEGVYLDRFAPVLQSADGRLPYYVGRFGPHLLSRYPIGTGLVALPLIAPQILVRDAINPAWDRDPMEVWSRCEWMAKRASAVLAALTGMLIYQIVVRIGLGRVALPTVLAAALGSNLWTVASQSLWQHGPVAFFLSLAIWLLLPRPLPRWRLVLAGLAVTALVWCRPIDLVLALAVALCVAWSDWRRLGWFLPFPTIGALALIGSNLVFFGTMEGGQVEIERLHPTLHGVPSSWSGDLRSGMAGTLFSPNRGLFVFCPWVLVALLTAPFATNRLTLWPIARWMLWSLVPFGLIFSKYAVWWGGHCFGPRYWTDVTPLLAILLATGLDWALDRSRLLSWIFALTIVWSIGVQAIGAFCYPSAWNLAPANVDIAHGRLWDWRDTELSRCLIDTYEARRRPAH